MAGTVVRLRGMQTAKYNHVLATVLPPSDGVPEGRTAVGCGGAATGKCAVCAAGQYKRGAGTGGCVACDEGFFQDASAQGSCKACPDRTFSATPGATGCATCDYTCAAGQYHSACGGANGGACHACGAGQYKAKGAGETCLNCEAGKHAASTGSASCTPCDGVSTFQDQPGKASNSSMRASVIRERSAA